MCNQADFTMYHSGGRFSLRSAALPDKKLPSDKVVSFKN